MSKPLGTYSRFIRFLLPLAITLIVVELGIQVLSAGMARVPNATETLAGYGVAWGLILLFTSPLTHAKSVSLVLGNSQESRRKIVNFIIALGLLLAIGLAALALTPLSFWIIEEVHSVSTELGNTVRFAILWLIPAPLLTGLAQYYTGQLLRAKRTVTVSLANVASIGSGIVVVFALLPFPFIQKTPIWLPILAMYVNLAVELGIVFWGVRHLTVANHEAKIAAESSDLSNGAQQASIANNEITYAEIFRFIWPLSLNISFQEFSRPLINMFVSRGPNGLESLAVLTVAYALGQFSYRWLNDLRNLAVAFHNEPGGLLPIRRFTIGCGFVSLAMMLGLFWTPLADFILITLMGLDAEFAALCRTPLRIFALFSFIVTLRTYCQSIALVQKRTYLFIYGTLPRLGIVWLTLVSLPLLGVVGAPLGVSALAGGFLAEALTIWWCVIGYPKFIERRSALPYASS